MPGNEEYIILALDLADKHNTRTTQNITLYMTQEHRI